MSTEDFELVPPPATPRARELWLQHAVGFILFQDARRYALDRIDATLDASARAAAQKAVDDVMYGLMSIIDGVTGGLRGPGGTVWLDVNAVLTRTTPDGAEHEERLALKDGDGMCMGFHAWVANDFGEWPVARARAGPASCPPTPG